MFRSAFVLLALLVALVAPAQATAAQPLGYVPVIAMASVVPTVAISEPSYQVGVGTPTTFYVSTTAPGGYIASRTWDLNGDGVFGDASLSSATWTYGAPGPVTVSVRVTSNTGATAEAQRQITVAPNAPPIATLTAPWSRTLLTNTSGRWSVSASDPEGAVLTFTWDLDDDGDFDDRVATSTFWDNANVTFPTSGSKTVSVRVSDVAGGSVTHSQTVTIAQNMPPSLSWHSTTTAHIGVGTPARFALSISDDGEYSSPTWDFDDDGVFDDASGNNRTFTFSTPGDYVVRARVVDDGGEPAVIARQFTVHPNTPPVAQISGPTTRISGQVGTYYAFASDVDGGTLTYAWEADGDGLFDDGSGSNRSFTLPAGIHAVQVRVTDQAGASTVATLVVNVAVNQPPQVAQPSVLPLDLAAGEPAHFGALAVDPEGTAITYAWDLDGNGSFETPGQQPSTQVLPAGRRTFTVRATDAHGGSSTASISVDVAADPPSAQGCDGPDLGVVAIIDNSSSMKTNDPDDLRLAASQILLDQVQAGTYVAMSTFAGGVSQRFAPTLLNDASRPTLKNIAANARPNWEDDAGTQYDRAFTEARRQLAAMPGSVTRKIVVFLSDGEPTDGSYWAAERQVAADGVRTYTVGFGDVIPATMAGIAARSRGMAFTAPTADYAQAAMARIGALLSCDAKQVDETVELDPGETRDVDFDIDPQDREYRALATWDSGDVAVSVVRPDATSYGSSQGSLRAGETMTTFPTYALATGIDPAAGRYRLRLHADEDAAQTISASIGIWKRTVAGQPPTAPTITAPAEGTTVEQGQPITTSWEPARGAESYDILVDEVIVRRGITGTTASITVDEPGAHVVAVQARNRYGVTPSDRRRVNVPARAPGADPRDPPTPPKSRWSSITRAPSSYAQAYMPRVFLDEDEPWRPLDFDAFLDREARVCASADADYEECPIASPASLPADGFLRYPVAPDREAQFPKAMYVQETVGQRWRLLDYWWFLRFNDAPLSAQMFDHTADWEGAVVGVLKDAPPSAPFSFISIASHENWWSYLREALRCGGGEDGEQTHTARCTTQQRVNVYTANGTHAGYPRRCSGIGVCGQNVLLRGEFDDYGVVVATPEGEFGGEVPAFPEGQRDLRSFSPDKETHSDWIDWPGAIGWQTAFYSHKSTVYAPSKQGYRDPFRSSKQACIMRWSDDDEDSRDRGNCDRGDFGIAYAAATGRANCDAWFGPMVAVSVCDSRAFGRALAAGTVESERSPAISGAGLQGARANGLSQATGTLSPGDVVTVSGAATSGMDLRVRVTVQGRQEEFRFTGLPTASKDPVTLRIGKAGVTAQTRSGRRLRLSGRRTVDARPVPSPRNLRARRSGSRVSLRASSSSQRLLVESLRSRTAIRASRRTILRMRSGRVTSRVKATPRDRFLRVTAISGGRGPSRAIMVRIR